ncbi:oligosaccharide flippase family protein [Polaromonas sp. P1-6]|nr:oligosaccharide flippase family protein [Polaromonas sp. P1-6]
MTLLRQSSLAAVAALVLTGSRFALAAILARRLSSSGFGQFVYAQWLVDMAFLVCSLGATGAVSRYVAEYHSDAAKLNAFIQKWRPWALGLPALAGGAVVVGTWMSGLALDLTSVILLALWAIASAAWAMQTAALTGFQRFDLIFYANLIAATSMLAGVLLLPVSANNPAILFALMAAASGMATLPGLSQTLGWKNVEAVAPISEDQWRSVRRYAVNMWLIALLWALLWS